MKKKIMALCLVACLASTAIIGGTLAYFTDNEKADNVFTVGNVDIVLTEPNWDDTGKAEAKDAYPGEALAKDPMVTNNGKNPCFVRIKVEGWDVLGEDNLITYRTNYQDGQLGEGWTYNEEDGYFYYGSVLDDVNKKTTKLFDQIVIPTSVTNGYDGNYDLVVKAEAVQAQGAKAKWADVQSMTVAEIAAWFATCMPASVN